MLSDWTTLRSAGQRAPSWRCQTSRRWQTALREAEAEDEPVLVLGGGSNVVVADEGFPGTVVRIAMRGVRFEPERRTASLPT